MSRRIHAVNAVMWAAVTIACMVVAGLDTIILPWWAMLMLIPVMPVSLCMAFREAAHAEPDNNN